MKNLNTQSKRRPHTLLNNIWVFPFVYMCLFVMMIDQFNALAEPRLAILELQGDVGTIRQQQAWTDTIRSAALKALTKTNITIIDRDQFRELLDPKRDLSNCIGLCAAEVAREVGAHWSLSGFLTAEPDTKDTLILLTLKLHSVSGKVIDIQQTRGSLVEVSQDHLSLLTQSVLQEVFTKVKSTSQRQDSDFLEPNIEEANQIVDTSKTSPNDDLTIASDQEVRQTEWTSLKLDSNSTTRCVSPLVSSAEYQQCVDAGTCQPAAQWGRCKVDPSLPIRCVNLQHALQYSKWRGMRLLTVKEWHYWSEKMKLDTGFYEWLTPIKHNHIVSWTDQLLSWEQTKLRSAKPQHVWRYVSRSSSSARTGKATSRRSPLAFQVPDLSFRVLSKVLSNCQGAR